MAGGGRGYTRYFDRALTKFRKHGHIRYSRESAKSADHGVIRTSSFIITLSNVHRSRCSSIVIVIAIVIVGFVVDCNARPALIPPRGGPALAVGEAERRRVLEAPVVAIYRPPW